MEDLGGRTYVRQGDVFVVRVELGVDLPEARAAVVGSEAKPRCPPRLRATRRSVPPGMRTGTTATPG